MIKNIVGDVRKLIHAGADCLHAVRKYYAFQNSLSEGEREYDQLNLEKAKLHIELDKTELARRKGMLAEEGAKKYGVAALQDMLARKEATTEPTLFMNKEELEQVVSGLQAAIQHSTYPAPDAPSPLAKSKMVSPQEIVEELECRIRELQGKLRNDTDAAAYQEIVNKLALTENRFQRAVQDCRVAWSARDALHAKNVELTEQLAGSSDREAVANVALTRLITDNHELSKKLRTMERTNTDLAERVASAGEHSNDLTEELGELCKAKATNTASIERLITDLQLEHRNATRAQEEAEESAARAERWESKSKEWYDALEAERKTVASLLEDRRLLHEANKKILALTGASSNETPVAAVERILNKSGGCGFNGM